MKHIEETGVHSVTFRNALAKGKRDAYKYDLIDNCLGLKYGYYLTDDEYEQLKAKLTAYYLKHGI